MKEHIFYLASDTPALRFAGEYLCERGHAVQTTAADSISDILLGVPSFQADGMLKGGSDPKRLLAKLPNHARIFGGNLSGNAALSGRKCYDLLQDPFYLAENANITAYCAVKRLSEQLSVTLDGCPVLILGWGRIGKCLAKLLAAMGAQVTVAARQERDRALLSALGYGIENPNALGYGLMRYRAIVNTVPAPILSEQACAMCRENCVLLDLASEAGITGAGVVWARGLPAKDAPESSGRLIARSILRICAAEGVKK